MTLVGGALVGGAYLGLPVASWAADARPCIQAGSRRGSHLWTIAPSLSPAHPQPIPAAAMEGPLERSLCLQRGPRSSPTPAALQPLELVSPALLGETAASEAGAGEAQGEPGVSASPLSLKTHPHWRGCVRKTRTLPTWFLNGHDWDKLGSNSSKLLTERNVRSPEGNGWGFGINVLTLLHIKEIATRTYRRAQGTALCVL